MRYKQKKIRKERDRVCGIFSYKDMPRYFNVLECGGNILNRLDLSYKRVCMATPIYEYYTKMLKTLIDHNDRHNAPLYSEKLQQEVSIVMAETEEEERDAKHSANNVTMDTFFNHSIISPSQGEIAIMTSVHSTISPSQGEIANMTSVHSTISPSQGEIANVTSVHSTISPSQEYANMTNERRIVLDILKETIK